MLVVAALRWSTTDRVGLTERQIYGLNLSTTTLTPTVSVMARAGQTGKIVMFLLSPPGHHIWSLQEEDHHNYLHFPHHNEDTAVITIQ